MTQFQLRIWDHTLSFRPVLVCLYCAAAVCALLMMSAYVDALRHSVSRGEALREVQRQGPTPRTVAVHLPALSR
ncbi:MAG: hypothetical protein ABI702_14990 [Burkholderiales bacterium]